MTQDFVMGIDIGGTSMVVAVVGRDGHIAAQTRVPTLVEQRYAAGFERLANGIDRALSEVALTREQIAGIGIGCTGPVDPDAGVIRNPFTLWDDAPVVDFLRGRYSLPVVMTNDAQAAALGEYWRGAGQGADHCMIYMTVGTGIGGGVIIDGRLFEGIDRLSTEIGHQALDPNGPPCYCGARGCLEMLAAAPAITAQAIAYPTDMMLWLAQGEPTNITPKVVYEAAEQGDEIAQAILRGVGVALGIGVANLLNIFAPQAVILGGGVMNGWSRIEPSLRETVEQRKGLVPLEKIRIERAALGLNAGVTGAAKIIWDVVKG